MKRIESSIDNKQMIFVESNDSATEILSAIAHNVESSKIGREKKIKSYEDATGQFSIQRRKQQEPKRMAQAKVLLCSDFFFSSVFRLHHFFYSVSHFDINICPRTSSSTKVR